MIERSDDNLFTKPWIVCTLALISCFLWGSAFPCVKIGYELFGVNTADTASVMLFAGMRFTFAGVLVVIFGSAIKRKVLIPQKSSWGKIVALCLVQTLIQYFFFYIGLANTTGVKSAIVEAMNVFVAILVSSFIFRQEKFTWIKAAGCVLGIFGVVLINLNGLTFDVTFTGEGFIFLSTVSYAFSSCFLKIFSKEEDTFVLSGYQFFLGGILLMLIGGGMGGTVTEFSLEGGGMLFYLAIISSVAYTLWGILLKYNKPSNIAAYGFMNPVFGVILSAIILQENVNLLLCILALVLITAGILCINLLGDAFNKQQK